LHGLVDRTRYIPLLAAPRLGSARERALAHYLQAFLRVYHAAARVSGSTVVIDSSKHASLAYCLRRARGLDLRVVHLVRDSRAVAYSWATKIQRPDSATESYMTTYAPATTAGVWNAQNAALQLLARSDTPVLRVRYEDLVAAPEDTLRRIASFAGIGVTDEKLPFLGSADSEPWANLTPAHTASGNPMRFAVGRIAIHADERWRTAMASRPRRTVTALTLPLLAYYGYTGAEL
jgi:hypothetical protein